MNRKQRKTKKPRRRPFLKVHRALGGRIRRLREKKGWDLESFARLCKISHGQMEKIERGEKQKLTFSMLANLARNLGVSVWRLFEGIA